LCLAALAIVAPLTLWRSVYMDTRIITTGLYGASDADVPESRGWRGLDHHGRRQGERHVFRDADRDRGAARRGKVKRLPGRPAGPARHLLGRLRPQDLRPRA